MSIIVGHAQRPGPIVPLAEVEVPEPDNPVFDSYIDRVEQAWTDKTEEDLWMEIARDARLDDTDRQVLFDMLFH